MESTNVLKRRTGADNRSYAEAARSAKERSRDEAEAAKRGGVRRRGITSLLTLLPLLGVTVLGALVYQWQYSMTSVFREMKETGHERAVLPPGTSGWPVLGEAANLFLEAHDFFPQRTELYNSSIFRTFSPFGHAIVMSGADHARMFYSNKHMLQRPGGLPYHIRSYIFGDEAAIAMPATDEEHAHRKRAIVRLLAPATMDDFLTIQLDVIRRHMQAWTEKPTPFQLWPLIRRAIVETSVTMWWGVHPTESELTQLEDWMWLQIRHFFAVPIYVPYLTSASRADHAHKDLIEYLAHRISKIRSQAEASMVPRNGLEAVALYRTTEGQLLEPEVAAKEAVNMGRPFIVSAGMLCQLLSLLHDHPQVLQRARQDVLAHWPRAEARELDMESLAQMRYLEATVNETRRYAYFVPMLPAEVVRPFEYDGFYFPKGWQVWQAVTLTHRDPKVWVDPENFNPDNFLHWKQHQTPDKFGYLQHGAWRPRRRARAISARFADAAPRRAARCFCAGNGDVITHHRCPGERAVTNAMATFMAVLLREFEWDVDPNQDLGVRSNELFPIPKMWVRGFRRAA